MSTDVWNSVIGAAVLAADIDTDQVTVSPEDAVWTLTRASGERVAFGEDGTDEDGQDWWTATFYTADDEIVLTDSYPAPTAMVAAVAEWAAQ